MKQTLTAIATATLATTVTAADLPPAGFPQEAQIRTLVTSITVAVDRAAYDLAEGAFAPEVVIDYTSLWGGEPATTTPTALMDSWRGIVPGFDATWHELGPVTVNVSGDTATASAFIDARHWIGDRLWRPVGTYHWDLAKLDGQWRVTRMELAMIEELGDRTLTALAMERAQQSEAGN
ncbi:SnoaL-like protein [Shimia isoporae]|uniref:SnoaL-like protein n=1 Tax=Shimia isoporae TaxID=647720 RepID=A0A4V2Q3Q4_9RHOB|nr:nuclear transport factor 2 family protein [Shimia isoporae]TCL08110.1 SnoaL-like protein [Shimia isoporae]